MAKLRQAVEHNLRQIDKLRYLNAFVTEADEYARTLLEESAQRHSEGRGYGALDGATFAVKDNLCVKGMTTTCASKFLQDYRSPYTATAVQRLLDKGCVLVGKSNLDEFAMGAGSVFSHFGAVKHPGAASGEVGGEGKRREEEEEGNESSLISGGSSGGSAVAVATGMCQFSLGSDTGGSVRIPASFCGVVGLKPSYGRVSRHGLIPLASSMDTVGVFAPDVATCALVLDAIAGWDVNDATSSKVPHTVCNPGVAEAHPGNALRGCRIGVIKDYAGYLECPEYESVVSEAVEQCRAHGAVVKEVTLPHLRYSVPTYYAICAVEAASNMAKYSGLVYGHSDGGSAESADQKFARSRMEGLGPVVQHRIIAGTYFLSYRGRHYFEKAARMRRLIFEDFKTVFDSEVDILLGPTTIGPAPSRGKFLSLGPVESTVYDTFTAPISLCGLPAISIPAGQSKDGLPLGLQLAAWRFQERRLIRVASALQSMLD